MPYSYSEGKEFAQGFILANVPINAKILDVGPGAGWYVELLAPHGYHLDCVEIFEPYVTQFSLRERYQTVFIQDVRNFDVASYDFIIFGDVLEHLTVLDAQDLVAASKNCLVAVPFNYPQGSVVLNDAEIHIQDDLTPTNVKERYPALSLLWADEKYGYYYKLEA